MPRCGMTHKNKMATVIDLYTSYKPVEKLILYSCFIDGNNSKIHLEHLACTGK